MTMPTRKSDNSHLAEKVWLRIDHSPPGPLSVLDAYGGKGVIWQEVKKHRDVSKYIAIEKERGKNNAALCGENEKLLPILDLSGFNVIDLDAYGIPVEQFEAVMLNKTMRPNTVIFATCILAALAPAPYEIGKYIGFSPRTMSKAKHLFNLRIKELLAAMLNKHGFESWTYYEFADDWMNKIYLCCTK